MATNRLKYKSTNLAELNGTVNEVAQTAIVAGAGVSCAATLFDDDKDARTTKDLTTGATLIPCQQTDALGRTIGFPSRAAVDDIAYIELDDGTFDSLAIESVQPEANTITVASPGLASAAAKGAWVSVKLGVAITMLEYGTPVVPAVTNADWGWRGIITSSHAGLEVGQNVRIQMILDGGTELDLREDVIVTVEGAT